MSYIDKLLPYLYIFHMKKKKQQPEIPEATPVKLKPILGMRPGLYLTILYAVVILLLFLLVFVYPGLKKNGAETSFSSLPEGAAVYMDGVYLGSTPFSTFVEKGRHTFTFEKPFFTTLERTRDIRGRIFATLLFPRREKISTRFEEENLQKYLNFRFEQVSNWALVGAF